MPWKETPAACVVFSPPSLNSVPLRSISSWKRQVFCWMWGLPGKERGKLGLRLLEPWGGEGEFWNAGRPRWLPYAAGE